MNKELVRDFTQLSDEELISAFRDAPGEEAKEAAAGELFRRYQPRIVRWCYRISGDREAALDLSQEILLRAYRNLDHYRGECRFTTWLYVITRNLCFSAIQKRASEPAWIASASGLDLPDRASPDLHSTLETDQGRRRQWDLILRTLDDTEAQVMMLHYGKELPLQAVSSMLGLKNKSGAKAYIVSARRKLTAAIHPPHQRAMWPSKTAIALH